MKALLAALLLLAPGARAAQRRQEEDEPKAETWSSMSMEAKAVMGELRYQDGDLAGAGDRFKDSLNSSRQLTSPQDRVVVLDLYRTAEIAGRKGDFATARERLELLLSRYPDSEFERRGRDLLERLPRHEDEAGAAAKPVMTADRAEFALAKIQSAVLGRRDGEALERCRRFLAEHPERAEADEIRLLGAALYLRLGRPAGAERALAFLVQNARDAEIRGKALHLLAALELSQGRDRDVLTLVPDVDARRSFSTWVSRAQLWRAAAEERLGRGNVAAARLRGLLASPLSSPVRAYALAELGRMLDSRRDFARAAETLQSAAREAARWGMEELAGDAELSRANVQYKSGRLAEAAASYGAFASAHPGHPQRAQALYQQGVALKRLGRREPAVAAFARVADGLPDSVYAYDATIQLGQLYTELGSPDKAIAQYERLGRSGDARGRRESPLLIAQVHYNAKRFKLAIPFYERFLAEYPKEPRRAEIEDLLLNSYWLGDRDDPAMLDAMRKYPNHAVAAHARWELGADAYRAGKYDKAAQWLSSYAADHPKAPHAAESLFFLGEAKLKLGDAPGAIEAYRARLAKYPQAADGALVQGRLGAALFSTGRYDESAAAFARAAEGPGAADALWDRALALSRAGHAAASLAAYESWLPRFPRDARADAAWLLVAQGREAAGKLSSAAEAYLRVRDQPHRALALFSAGRLREKLKEPGLAADAYRSLRALKPANDPIRLRGLVRLGLLEEVAGRPLQAMSAYAEAVKLAPRGGADAKAALTRMEALTSDGSLLARRDAGSRGSPESGRGRRKAIMPR